MSSNDEISKTPYIRQLFGMFFFQDLHSNMGHRTSIDIISVSCLCLMFVYMRWNQVRQKKRHEATIVAIYKEVL